MQIEPQKKNRKKRNMSAKSLIIERPAKKKLKKFPTEIHIRIITAFVEIQNNPLVGEKLRGELQGYYKFRVGDYRIVYSFNSKQSKVSVVKIEHRQGIYK